MRKGVFVIYLLFLVVGFFVAGVFAQEEGPAASDIDGGEVGTEEVVDGGSEIDLEDELYSDVEAVLEAEAGVTPDSLFYGLEKAVEGFFVDDPEEFLSAQEEAVREAESMIRSGNVEGARRAMGYARDYGDVLEREVPPELERRARESSKAIKSVWGELDDILEGDEWGDVRSVVEEHGQKQDKIASAAKISAQIKELCQQLVELGEFGEADKICKVGDQEGPEWLKKERGRWKEKMSEDAEGFFRILVQCMDVTDDGIEGNYNECECDKMPKGKQDLCFSIAKAEDACSFGDEDACGSSDDLVDEFMLDLPDDLRGAMERAMEEFEEEEFERRKPSECSNVDEFRECMLIMAERHIQFAPESCRDALREGIRSGEVRGERDGKRICEEIMFRENAPEECVEAGIADSDECGKYFGGFGRKGAPPKAGVSFDDCEGFEKVERKLQCYRNNVDKVGFAGEYYGERERFRFEDDFDHGEFDKRFKESNRDRYRDFYDKDTRYRYDEGDESREDYQALIDATIDRCESQSLPWFCDGPPSKPCYCGKNYDYRQYEQKPYPDYDYPPYPGPGDRPYPDYESQPSFDCAVMDCLQGSYCDPYRGCVSETDPYPDSGYPEGPTPCGTGEFYDYSFGGCKPTQESDSQCGPGYHWDAALPGCTIDCPAGYTSDGSGGCSQDSYPGDSSSSGGGSGGCASDEYWVSEPGNPPNYGYCEKSSEPGNNNGCDCGNGCWSSTCSCSSDCPVPSGEPSTEPPPSESPPEETPPPEEPPPGTGSVITGNAFLDYFYGF